MRRARRHRCEGNGCGWCEAAIEQAQDQPMDDDTREQDWNYPREWGQS